MLRIRRIDRLRATGDDSAADEFSDTWEDEVGYVTYVDAVEGCGAGYAVVDREKKLAPTDGPYPECSGTCDHRKKDKLPTAGLKLIPELSPFHFSERDPEEEDSQGC